MQPFLVAWSWTDLDISLWFCESETHVSQCTRPSGCSTRGQDHSEATLGKKGQEAKDLCLMSLMFVYHLILHFVKKTEHDQHMSTLHCLGVGRLGAMLIQVKALQGINKHSCDFTAAGLRCSLLAKELQVWHLCIISARSAAWCCVAYSTHCKRWKLCSLKFLARSWYALRFQEHKPPRFPCLNHFQGKVAHVLAGYQRNSAKLKGIPAIFVFRISNLKTKPRLVLQAKHIARQAFISCYWLHAIPPACHAEQEISFLETLLRNALENCCKHFERVRKHGCSTMVPRIHSSITRQSTKGQPALKSPIQP